MFEANSRQTEDIKAELCRHDLLAQVGLTTKSFRILTCSSLPRKSVHRVSAWLTMSIGFEQGKARTIPRHSEFVKAMGQRTGHFHRNTRGEGTKNDLTFEKLINPETLLFQLVVCRLADQLTLGHVLNACLRISGLSTIPVSKLKTRKSSKALYLTSRI